MDKETVINLARKAGFDISEKWKQISCDGYDYTDEMQKFAALIASHEREECARICEFPSIDDLEKATEDQGEWDSLACAKAIRMRSNAELWGLSAAGREGPTRTTCSASGGSEKGSDK